MFQADPSAPDISKLSSNKHVKQSLNKVISTFRKLQLNSHTKEFIAKSALDLQLFEEMEVGVYLIDYQLESYAYVNQGLATILGLDKSDFINQKVNFFIQFIHKDDIVRLSNIVYKMSLMLKKLSIKDRSLVQFKVYYRIKRPKLGFCWCLQSNKLIEDPSTGSLIDMGTIMCLPGNQPFDRVAGYLITPKKTIEILGDHARERKGKGKLNGISTRELEVLSYVSKGFSSKEIAERLNISEQTIKIHRKNILKKLNVNSSLHAIRLYEESMSDAE